MYIPGTGDYSCPDTKENQRWAINNQFVFGFVTVKTQSAIGLGKVYLQLKQPISLIVKYKMTVFGSLNVVVLRSHISPEAQ